jgi:hypothetical protein
VLILKFDQKVTINLEALKEGLPSWAAVTRMDPDGMTARIGLIQTPRLHVSSSVDLAAIDLVPDAAVADPPDIVSPLVAKRKAEAEAERIAAIPPPPVQDDLEVRGSSSGDSSRIAFYWPSKVTYKVVEKGEGKLKLLFSHRAKADLAYLHITPPPNLSDFQGENTNKGYLVTITSKDGLPIKHFMEGDVAVIDITRPLPPEKTADAAPAEKSPGKAAAKAEAAKPEPPKVQPVAAKTPPEKPSLLVPPKGQPLDDAQPAESQVVETKANSPPTLGGPNRVTDLSPNWVDAAPRLGVIDVKISPLASGLDLQVAFNAPAPAAVFSRGSAVWAVFAANADLRVDPTALPGGYRVRTMRGVNATMMRIEMPKGFTVSADSDDSSWTIRLAPSALRPQRFIKVDRPPGSHGRIEAMLVGAAGLVWFEDPVIGDQVAAVVAYGPASASPTPKDFIEANLPATAHGLAVAPKSDDVVVTLEGERLVVSTAGGAPSVADALPTSTKKIEAPANAAFVDFATWGRETGAAFYKKRSELEAVAAENDPASQSGSDAMMALARFYVGHDMALEALGILRTAAEERGDIEQDPRFLGLRGAANVMAHRLAEADDSLSRGPLRDDPSAALWRARVAAERGEWERANEFFVKGADQILTYPPDKAAEFLVARADAALHMNDYEGARRNAGQAAATGTRPVVERAQLILAMLSNVVDGPSAAYDEFDRLAKTAAEPVAVRAELKRLEAGVASGKMTANDAAGELEMLRFRWRGDDVEMDTVGILADQYMRVGRFRDALMLARSTAMRDVGAPGARELRIKLSDYFKRLFLNGEADRLDPIQSLALFYEFADELTPIGTDGDQMIRKLAQRLVAFDLLEPAAELLQHQVDFRMRGVSKAAIAVDLATIYLMDKRPDRALAAINSTRQPSLPNDLAIERRLLEAAAYRDLGHYDHVVELMEPLDSIESKSLLADAYWRDRKWPEAARAFLTMLPPANAAKPADADIVLKAAIAGRLAKDTAFLSDLRRYASVFAGNPNKASFDLITTETDISGAALTEAIRRLADAPRVDAFAAAMKQRFDAAKAAPAAAPAPATPAPAKLAAPAPADGAKAGETAAAAEGKKAG